MTTFYAIGWIVTFLGWWVSNQQANTRESRKETRAEVDALVKSIESARGFAMTYYSKDGEGRAQARLDLMPMFGRIETRINILGLHDTAPLLDDSYSEFYEAITDGDFDSSTLKALPLSDVRYTRITTASEKLILEVEKWFYRTYKSACPNQKHPYFESSD